MNGPGHILGGLSGGLAYIQITHPAAAVSGYVLLFAGACSAGFFSPDGDNSWLGRKIDRHCPDELLGKGGPLQHRGLSHCPMSPGLLLWLNQSHMPGTALFLANAPWVGWLSHQILDFFFGQNSNGKAAGVPMVLWWGHLGVGFKNGGPVEKVTTRVLLPALILWQTAWYLTGTPQPWTLVL